MQKPYLYMDVLSDAQVYVVRHWLLNASFCYMAGHSIVNLALFVLYSNELGAESKLINALAMGIFLGICWLLIKPRHYVIGREGLIYFSGIYVYYTPWENISKFDLFPRDATIGLILKNSLQPIPIERGIGEGQAAIISNIRPNRRIKITSRYDERNHISLSLLPIFWRRDPLVKAIQHHIPQS